MFDDETVEEFIDAVIGLDAFQTLSGGHIECPACETGILITVDSDPPETFQCDICGAAFKTQSD